MARAVSIGSTSVSGLVMGKSSARNDSVWPIWYRPHLRPQKRLSTVLRKRGCTRQPTDSRQIDPSVNMNHDESRVPTAGECTGSNDACHLLSTSTSPRVTADAAHPACVGHYFRRQYRESCQRPPVQWMFDATTAITIASTMQVLAMLESGSGPVRKDRSAAGAELACCIRATTGLCQAPRRWCSAGRGRSRQNAHRERQPRTRCPTWTGSGASRVAT